MIDMECIEASLNVNTGNAAAITLYKSNGFRVDYKLKGFYGDEDPVGPDAYQMEMRLHSTTYHKCRNKQSWKHYTPKEWHLVHQINSLLVLIETLC